MGMWICTYKLAIIAASFALGDAASMPEPLGFKPTN